MIDILFAAMLAAAKPPEPATGTNVPKGETSQPVDRVGRPLEGTPGEPEPTDSALKSARATAACVVRSRPREVEWLLAAKDRETFETSYRRIKYITEHCLGGTADADVSTVTLAYGNDTMMGVLAEASLVRSPLSAVPAIPLASAPDFTWLRPDRAGQVVLHLASCLAATQPERVAAVLATRPDSPQEAASFGALVPAIAPCLEKDVTLRAKRAPLRLYLALAYYRRAHEPLPQQAQDGAGNK
jgi:hypothetical protein